MPTLNVSLQSALDNVASEVACKGVNTYDGLSIMRKAVKDRHADTFVVKNPAANGQDAVFWRTQYMVCMRSLQRAREVHRVARESNPSVATVFARGARQPESTQNTAIVATLRPERPVPQVGNMESPRYVNKLRLGNMRAQMEETQKPAHRVGLLWSEMQNPVFCDHCQRKILPRREYYVAHYHLPSREDSEPRASHFNCFKKTQGSTLATMTSPVCMDFFTLNSKQMAYVRRQILCAQRSVNTHPGAERVRHR
ncbi:hypothetical protein CYMTET_55095 [Cymbomonas tetramitiformis]|uniref:Uncharacterized protein n=1 Tax=Cymbomonas tetramitiformis TaxID=36881 RepID=A0AAE0BF74_9CHLO|nr:hypothetical protein CYMTET_55095 [Cymbomonas tetramitiformis]